jgi:hypothetical protein
MRKAIVMLWLLMGSMTAAMSQVSIGIGLPNLSIGINLPLFPELVQVPNYPVYYAPGLSTNYFFYDGMYWVYQDDDWYASAWYNGPWGRVAPYSVPLFILRVPVRYYRQPPMYFRAWRPDAPPRWGEHWGGDWQQRRSGWDRWDRNAVPRPAPLPVYQRQYTGERYPRAVDQQQALRSQNYRYQPRETVVQQHLQQQRPAQPQPQSRPQQQPQSQAQPQPRPQQQQPQQQPPGPAREQAGARPGPRDNPPRQEAAPQSSQRKDRDVDRDQGGDKGRDKGDPGDKRDRGDKGDKGDKGDDRGRGREK